MWIKEEEEEEDEELEKGEVEELERGEEERWCIRCSEALSTYKECSDCIELALILKPIPLPY